MPLKTFTLEHRRIFDNVLPHLVLDMEDDSSPSAIGACAGLYTSLGNLTESDLCNLPQNVVEVVWFLAGVVHFLIQDGADSSGARRDDVRLAGPSLD